jgi:hypothetical protein
LTSDADEDMDMKLNRAVSLVDQELAFIRCNITLERIERVEKAMVLAPRRTAGVRDLERYFRGALMESVYRAHKGSFKIADSKDRAEEFLAMILYVLFGEPEVDPSDFDHEPLERRIRAVLKKWFRRDSYFSKYALRYLATKTGDKIKKTSWIDIGPYAYPILGGELFYYCTLRALLDVCRKALTDKSYSTKGIITWEQGIVTYIVAEVRVRSKKKRALDEDL